MPNFILDGSFFAYRAYSANSQLSTTDGRNTGLLYGFTRGLFALKKKYPKHDFIVAWDSIPNAKRSIYAEYKMNRVQSDWSISPQAEVLRILLQNINVDQVLCENEEADDVIGSTIDPATQNIILSTDRDYLQLVEGIRILLLSPKRGDIPEKIYDENLVLKEYDVTPKEFPLYKVFKGDSGDNVPGVPRLPHNQVVKLAKMGSIDAVYASVFPGFTEKQYKAVQEFKDQAYINEKLVTIKRDLTLTHIQKTLDLDTVEKICTEYQMFSLRSDLPIWKSSP